MPIYEFKCKSCGNIFECVCLRSDEKDQTVCPCCGHGDAEMLFSTFSCKGSTPGKGTNAVSSSCSSPRGFS